MFVEDLSVFFSDSDFADSAAFTLPGNSTRNALVIFNSPTQETQIYGTAIETEEPFLTCKSSDLVGVRTKTGRVTVKGKTYIVERIADDGTGVSTVYLKS